MRVCGSVRLDIARCVGILAVGVVVAVVIGVDASAGNETPAPFTFGWTPGVGGGAAASAPGNNFFNPQCVQKLFGLTTQCPSQTFSSMGDVNNHNLTRAEIEVILNSEEVMKNLPNVYSDS